MAKTTKTRVLRPKLHEIAPLTAWLVKGFAVLNLLLGTVICFFFEPKFHYVIITPYTPLKMWGSIFLLMGILTAYGIVTNNWPLMRLMMLCGITLKTIWSFAILFSAFNGGSVLFLVVWLAFAYSQFGTYIYFAPMIERERNE